MAHVHGRPDNEEEHLDEILGRGKGDPDHHQNPMEPDDIRWVGGKPKVEYHEPDQELEGYDKSVPF